MRACASRRGNLPRPNLNTLPRRHCEARSVSRGNLSFDMPNHLRYRRLLRRPKYGLLAMTVGGCAGFREPSLRVPVLSLHRHCEPATAGVANSLLRLSTVLSFRAFAGGVAISLLLKEKQSQKTCSKDDKYGEYFGFCKYKERHHRNEYHIDFSIDIF